MLADINTHLYGKSKDFAVFFLFKMLLEKDKLLAYSKSSLFKEYCRDVEYISYIMANLSSTNQTVMNDKEVGENTDELVDIALNEKTLVNIFDSLRGKVIYIDFWASWCIPCLEEMSYSADLLKKYKGTDVVFLFLSLDAFVDKWRRANDVLPKSKMALSFLIRNSETNYFISKYKIQSIPRYMIVDKNGLIMDNDAPRPSEARLSNILVQLTSK